MGLRADVLRLPLEARFNYDEEKNILFLNFEELEVKRQEDIEAIRNEVIRICEPLGHRVYTVVNYEGFVLDRSVEDAYVEMISDTVARYYVGVTRFTTSAFMRANLSDTSPGAASRPMSTRPRQKRRRACRTSPAATRLAAHGHLLRAGWPGGTSRRGPQTAQLGQVTKSFR